jgi:hypothetical protein
VASGLAEGGDPDGLGAAFLGRQLGGVAGTLGGDAVGYVVLGGDSLMWRFENCFTGFASMKSHATAHEQRQLIAAKSRRTVAPLAPAFIRALA